MRREREDEWDEEEEEGRGAREREVCSRPSLAAAIRTHS